MGKQAHDTEDARVFRITARRLDSVGAETFTKEVLALYWQNEQGFVVFKDLGHAAVYTIAAESILEIERLRTHVILAIASEELGLILDGLRMLVAQTDFSEPQTSDEATKTAYVRGTGSALIESLDRLRPIAAERHAEDVSSLPRVSVHGGTQTRSSGGSVKLQHVTSRDE